jgi:hypothetical protein
MKTGCLFTATGPGRVVIARFAPRSLATLPRFPKLAPHPRMIGITDKPTFCRYYFGTVLGRLDAAETWRQLHELVAPHEPILLCYERLEAPVEWCHRTMVAEWFRDQLGYDVTELGAATSHESADLRRANVSRSPSPPKRKETE